MTLPNYNRGAGFYDPGKTYNGAQNFQLPGFAQQIYGTEESPQGAYTAYGATRGLGGLGSRASRFQQLYGQVKNAYEAAKYNSNMELMFPEFLDQSRVADVFNSQSYEQQGLDMGRYGQKPYRWSMRG